MKLKKNLKKTIAYLIFFTIFFTELYILPHTAHAATLQYYNSTSNTNVTYTGKQVIYTYNSRKLPLTYPGIIMNGIALADYNELFVRELGLQASLSGNVVTLTDGSKTIELTMGSKIAKVNGVTKNISIAPVKLIFSEEDVRFFVPTRFVAETFGYNYVWVSNSNTAKITKTFSLNIGNNPVSYNGSLYSVCFQGEKIDLNAMPVIYYNGTVIAPAKTIFEAMGCHYEETEQTMLISNGSNSMSAELNDKTAFVNGKKYIMNLAPIQVTDNVTGDSCKYISLEFASEMLGFEVSYMATEHQYMFTAPVIDAAESEKETVPDAPEAKITVEPPQPIASYFEWVSEESTEVNSERNYLTKVVSYAVEFADVVELYGITKENINAFIDNGTLIMELNSVDYTGSTQYYADFNNGHLNYSLLTKINDNTKMIFMLPPEDTWHISEKEDCIQIYFMNADLTAEDLFPSSVIISSEKTPVYPDDCLVIPLPEEIIPQVSDQDNYLNNNFQIMLSGNHLKFYEHNSVINPYYMVTRYEINYDEITDTTTFTFHTNTICGYNYSVEDGYLSIIVARPSELYSKILVLDPGHGGTDPGASRNGVREKDLNFKILNTYVKELFENSEIKVYFTRETDVLINLYDRAAMSEEIGADMFISLHMNTNNNTTVAGTEVFYSGANNKTMASGLNSYQLAKTLANNLSTVMSTRNRGATKSEFVVVKYNTVPAVLIELGFMSNSAELSKLTDEAYQKKAAETIYNSVLQLFELYPTGR